MAARNSGSKMVFAAVAATVAAVGVGTIYLPFIADKDRIRGLNEESDMTAGEKREYQEMMRKMGGGQMPPSDSEEKRSLPSSNSMWSRMNQAASGQKK